MITHINTSHFKTIQASFISLPQIALSLYMSNLSGPMNTNFTMKLQLKECATLLFSQLPITVNLCHLHTPKLRNLENPKNTSVLSTTRVVGGDSQAFMYVYPFTPVFDNSENQLYPDTSAVMAWCPQSKVRYHQDFAYLSHFIALCL